MHFNWQFYSRTQVLRLRGPRESPRRRTDLTWLDQTWPSSARSPRGSGRTRAVHLRTLPAEGGRVRDGRLPTPCHSRRSAGCLMGEEETRLSVIIIRQTYYLLSLSGNTVIYYCYQKHYYLLLSSGNTVTYHYYQETPLLIIIIRKHY